MPGYTREMSIEEFGLEETVKYEENARDKAEESYDADPNAKRKYCPHCNQLMRYNSLAYIEEFHFDSCY